MASRFRNQLIYIAAPALLWHLWSLALYSSYAYRAKMIKIVAPWYFSPLVTHAFQVSAMSATIPDVRHTCNQQSAWCDQRATHLVLEQFRYHLPNASSVQTFHPLADIQMKWIGLYATSVHIQAKLGQENLLRMVRWHCPPDTGFEIQTLEVWGRTRDLSVTEVPHNTEFHKWMGKKHFCFFSNRRDRETDNRTLAWKAAVLTTTLEPPPSRFTNSSTKECCTGESSYWNTGRSWMFRCCPMMRKRAYKASYTIKKVTRFVYMYQLYIQLHHVMSDDLDIFCLIVTCN